MTLRVLSQSTLDAVADEAVRAHQKHVAKGGSLLDPGLSVEKRLAALMEEVGEVARVLTYDQGSVFPTPDDERRAELKEELIQTANVALTWVEFIKQEEEASNAHR